MAKVLGSLVCTGGVILLILHGGIPLNKATHSGKSSHNAKSEGTEVVHYSTQRWILGLAFLLICIVCWSGWFLIQQELARDNHANILQCFAIKREYGIFGSGMCYVGMSWSVQTLTEGSSFYISIQPFRADFYNLTGLLYVLLCGKGRGEVDNINEPTLAANPNGSSPAAADATQFSDSYAFETKEVKQIDSKTKDKDYEAEKKSEDKVIARLQIFQPTEYPKNHSTCHHSGCHGPTPVENQPPSHYQNLLPAHTCQAFTREPRRYESIKTCVVRVDHIACNGKNQLHIMNNRNQ
ncbi:hypothetical protein Cgig2_017341 [Carnegiea gigantea]|uniref:Uncharacterized protein n=1 Tax=Carnegiea gigantea TaxID=171969 RepID=A0A9Q1K442_9CARY|nr:hypothetical protein Cgig2_017341 [Carnegiea gigantea]